MSRFIFIFMALLLCFAAAGEAAERASPASKTTLLPPKTRQLKAATGTSPVISGVRFGQNAGKTRIVIDLDRQIAFRGFLLDGPKRVVIDLPDTQWAIPSTRSYNDSLIKGYRSGDLDGGLTRLIFDLRKPAVIDAMFVLPKTATAKDRLVIDLKNATANGFAAALQNVHGDRDLQGTAAKRKTLSDTSAAQDRAVQSAGNAPTAPGAVPLPPKKPQQQTQKPAEKRKYAIVVDAGHGGEDPGALGPQGIKEKNITLAAARELKRQLEETGRYKVVLTRDSDKYIKLRDRVDFSRRVGADLFISLHADKIDRKNVRGASIYSLSENASDAETARLADQENKSGVVAGVDLKDESAEVADILLDLAMREKMNESNLLARMIVAALQRKNVQLLPNSHRSAGFAVLKAPDVPSVLIEIGFLSNPEEAKLLNSSAFQRKIGSAIQDGIDAYFRKIEALQKI